MDKQYVSSRYHIHETLGSGGMGVVYRATDRLTNAVVALKQVTTPAKRLRFKSRSATDQLNVSLANEFQSLASLKHPNIIGVLDYGFNEGAPFFTMEYIPNARDVVTVGIKSSTSERVRLLLQILQALVYLHRRGIIHRDLKTENALVGDDNNVRVLDFGLADENPQAAEDGKVVGTLACIAPEVLQGAAPTLSADLYAVGLMAFEMFAGRYPFATDDPTALVYDIVQNEPQWRFLDAPEPIMNVIKKLLKKRPDERYLSAEATIEAFKAAMDSPPDEDEEANRNSFLQAARFVGREDERETLTDALKYTLAGRGSAWLVGGESGVRKSRLLNEIRTQAMVNGARVLFGQGVAGGGLPFQLWRDPIRHLALSIDISDMDAAVLKQIAPDLPRLLGRDIPDAPTLDSEGEQKRLINAIVATLRTITSPVVLILEDLHWMDESLEPIKQLSQIVAELPILIMSSYRSDERPNLHETLSEMQHIQLTRLAIHEIVSLSESMLGNVGREPQVVDLLHKETEGNIFFIVETVRTLAEEAGRLSNVGRMTLPETVFAGGVQNIIERRLNNLPATHRPVLHIAAITGRQLDLDILTHIMPDIDMDKWLTACVNNAIIERADDNWQFAHDKLREGVLMTLEPDEKQRLHTQVAEAIEHIYADDESRARVLADHWRAADNPTKEATYAFLTGDQLRNTQTSTGKQYLERAKELLDHEDTRYIETLWMLASIYIRTTKYDEAEALLNDARQLAQQQHDNVQIAHVFGTLTDLANRKGETEQAQSFGEQAVIFSRLTDENMVLAQQLSAYGGILVDMGDYDKAQDYFTESLSLSQAEDDYFVRARTYNNMGVMAYRMGDADKAWEYFEHAMEARKAAGLRHSVANSLNNLGVIAAAQGKFEQARQYHEESYAIKKSIGDRFGMSNSLTNMGIASMSQQNHSQAESYFRQALQLSRDIDNRMGVSDNLNNIGLIIRRQNGDLNEALRYLEEAIEKSQAIQDPVGHALALTNAGDVLLMLGKIDEAVTRLTDGIREAHNTGAMQPLLRGIMWMGYVQQQNGDVHTAMQWYSFVNLHNGADEETRIDSERLLQDLADSSSISDMVNAIEQSKQLQLDDIVATILAGT